MSCRRISSFDMEGGQVEDKSQHRITSRIRVRIGMAANVRVILCTFSGQLDAAFARIKALKGKQAAHFTGDELAALGNFALALTPSEIGQISDASYQ